MRTIDIHHDGHGLNESISIVADALGPGGASHMYTITIDGATVAEIQFQKGPRHVPGSVPGVTEAAVLAVLIDRLECFQRGDYACDENNSQLIALTTALNWCKKRADARAQRGVLGTYTK